MSAYVLWQAYAECILGREIEDAAEKFEALAPTEQAAWVSVALMAYPDID